MPELSRQRRYLVLAICCMSLFIVGIDSTIVNVALPDIGRDFHAPVSGLQWTIDAYTLVLAALLMLSGSTADRLGRRRVFQIGLALFTIGSLLCSLAPGLGWLVAFRMVQAVGGSMLNPVAMSIITNTFTQPSDRARAIGVWGGVFGLSMAMGPVVGGALVDSVGWRGVFWVNIPVGIAAILLTALFVPESKAARARRPDPIGQVLIIAMLGSLTYGIIEGPSYGWGSARILAFFAVTVIAVIAFLFYEPRREDPLIDIRFFRSLPFSGATLTAVSATSALGGFLFLITLYLQDVRGYRPLFAGLFLLPMAAAMAVGALTTLSSSTGYVLAWVALAGLGLGLVMPSAMGVALGALSAERSGAGSALITAMRQVGSTIGVAILGTVISNIYADQVAAAVAHLPAQTAAAVQSGVGGGTAIAVKLGDSALLDTVRNAFVHGMDVMLWTCGGIAVGCALLAVTFLRSPQASGVADAARETAAGGHSAQDGSLSVN